MRFWVAFFVLVFALESLAQAPSGGLKPLTREQLTRLVAAGMDNTRLAQTVAERGIDFALTEEDLETLRIAGADESLLQTIRDSTPFGEISVETSPGAEVWLDNQKQGYADADGHRAIRIHISFLNPAWEPSDVRHHLYSCGYERDEDALEVETQWVRNKTSPFSSLLMPR